MIDSKHKHSATKLSCSERHLRRRIKPIMDDGYQNEDYWNEDYQNDILSDKFSQNAEVSSESEPGSAGKSGWQWKEEGREENGKFSKGCSSSAAVVSTSHIKHTIPYVSDLTGLSFLTVILLYTHYSSIL